MIKKLTFVLFLGFSLSLIAQPITTIKGWANDYVGKSVKVFVIEDYLSQVKTQIASSKVEADSTFEMSFYQTQTRKLRVETGDNYFYIYAQPNAEYSVFVESSSIYESQKRKGIEADFFFMNLDSTDINYKILRYEDAQFNFLQENYNQRSRSSIQFVQKLDTFKLEITKSYASDTSVFLKKYIKFSIAALDDLAFVGQRNAYEKYDFYIKPETVWYQNDKYMDYIMRYYQLYEKRLANAVNEKFYDAVIQSSPTLAMNALGGDYALKNVRLREFIMLKMLTDVFYSNDYPQTNILTIMDSVEHHALFKEHKRIAKNLQFRLLELVPGTNMPNFKVNVKGENKFKSDYSGKHLYIQFIKKDAQKSIEDMPLLHALHQKYLGPIQFLTVLIVEEEDELLDHPNSFIKSHKISWDLAITTEDDAILKDMNVKTFPHYVLMDAKGAVVAAPALSPRPDNEYETIENVFMQINRRYKAYEDKEEDYR